MGTKGGPDVNSLAHGGIAHICKSLFFGPLLICMWGYECILFFAFFLNEMFNFGGLHQADIAALGLSLVAEGGLVRAEASLVRE